MVTVNRTYHFAGGKRPLKTNIQSYNNEHLNNALQLQSALQTLRHSLISQHQLCKVGWYYTHFRDGKTKAKRLRQNLAVLTQAKTSLHRIFPEDFS